MQRQAINNSIFTNVNDTGEAVSDWTYDYNKPHQTTRYNLQRTPRTLIT
jgi:hypothetical protein